MKQLTVLCILVLLVIAGSSFSSQPAKMNAAALGRLLFSDPVLSEDSSVSCASCHKPQFAFADTAAFSRGVHGRLGRRNVPSVMNMSARTSFFWDGRVGTLAQQALFPVSDTSEMNLPVQEAVRRLNRSKKYRTLFYTVYRQLPNEHNLGAALQAFEETLETGDTPNDRWLNDETGGLTAQQVRGRAIFRTKGKCLECHFTPDFTADEFRSIGLFDGQRHNDSGRYKITHDAADIGKFKVPGLRNVVLTAPYMHDGSMKTLREVIDYYNNPHATLPNGINRDSVLRQPLGLTDQEKDDLEAFLHALTDDRFVRK